VSIIATVVPNFVVTVLLSVHVDVVVVDVMVPVKKAGTVAAFMGHEDNIHLPV
jgi:hypothetical protein